MNTRLQPKDSGSSAQQGSALLTTMILTCILTVSLAGYIGVVSQQNRLSARAQGWNLAIAIAEAGIEEGLQHLNANSTKLSVDGWEYEGGSYTVTRQFSDGNGYTVRITNSSRPMIVSQAHINNFTFSTEQKSLNRISSGNNNQIKTITRTVQVSCSKGSLFTKALAVQSSIDMNGNNVLTDSYDSSDMFASSNGMYSSKLAGSSGDIACNGTLKNAVDIGNANIYGKVSTGPNVSVKIGKKGGIGSKDWQEANGGSGVQDGWVTDDSNFTFPDTALPYKTGLPLSGGEVVTADYSISSESMTTSSYPSSKTSGSVATNVSHSTSSFYPNPAPKGISTNTSMSTSLSLPNPIPAEIKTNTTTTTENRYPNPGTYSGSITTNVTYRGRSAHYTYTYNAIASYTFPVFTYTYPVYTYSYSVTATNTTYTTNYYDNILYSGDYAASSLKGSTLIAGKARLILTDGLEMGSKDKIDLKSGASIEMYVDGASVSIIGKGVANQTGKPADFIMYCTPNVTDVKIAGNATFVGLLVAPKAKLVLNGGGKDNQDFCGSAMVDSLVMNGSFNFHYDKALSAIGGNGRYLIESWDELQ